MINIVEKVEITILATGVCYMRLSIILYICFELIDTATSIIRLIVLYCCNLAIEYVTMPLDSAYSMHN